MSQRRKRPKVTDIHVTIDSSLVLLRPDSGAGKEWLEKNIDPEGFQPWLPTVVCERRYASAIIDGMAEDGLIVTGEWNVNA